MQDNTERLVSAVQDYLDEQEYNYDFEDDNQVFRLSMSLKSKLNNCRIIIRPKEDGINFTYILAISADDDSKAAIAEFLTRANYGLVIGNFQMDYSDGEIGYKNFMYTGEDVPISEDIDKNFVIPLMMLERYGDGILKTLEGYPADKAVEECEAK